MINIENTLSKIEEKKQLKKESLMASAYNLFIKKVLMILLLVI